MTVEPLFAQWLQADASFAVRADEAAAQRWGDTARTVERTTGIATLADAKAEADRQIAFFALGPFAVDAHEMPGTDWGEELGRIVRMTADDLGYSRGIDVFVIGIDVDRAAGVSTLTVLCPIGGAA